MNEEDETGCNESKTANAQTQTFLQRQNLAFLVIGGNIQALETRGKPKTKQQKIFKKLSMKKMSNKE
jgi:hypothetical protein